MLSIEWDDTYSTGISLLDTQNKHFVELVNLLLEYQDNDPDHDFLCQMLWNLSSYARDHFRQEEFFYEQHSLHEAAEHRQEHLLFQKKLNHLCADVTREGPDASKKLCEYVRYWTVVHITQMDKKVAQHIKCSNPT